MTLQKRKLKNLGLQEKNSPFNKVAYRIQDREGRGPFKPGVPMQWIIERDDLWNLKPHFVDFPNIREIVHKASIAGLYVASACESVEHLRRWVLPEEWNTLRILGYRAYEVKRCQYLLQSDVQLLIAREVRATAHIRQFDLYD